MLSETCGVRALSEELRAIQHQGEFNVSIALLNEGDVDASAGDCIFADARCREATIVAMQQSASTSPI
ncbi:hypothetical protein [Sorangium sp. So ce128]|uniref:hypothetical protein n=1 Tax=Sorangium sp. So ce128 TaxID=3133281 RepID=UPI003F5EC5CB